MAVKKSVKKCPQCRGKMQRVLFDAGYGVEVESMHCAKCGYNITEGGKLKKAIAELRGRMSKDVKIIRVGEGLGIRFPNEFVKSYKLRRGMHALMKPGDGYMQIVAGSKTGRIR